ncbi:hypothetical protein V1511DRAFT_485742 [Dipodascopsis uninucleata]
MGPYTRSDGAKIRGRVISMLVGGISGLYLGVKMIPYELISKTESEDTEKATDERPFLSFKIQNAEPLELKAQYREALHKQRVEQLIKEMKANNIRGHNTSGYHGPGETEPEVIAVEEKESNPDPVLNGFDTKLFQQQNIQSTEEWLKLKFGKSEK